jgi:hypothetical protein
LGGWKLVLSFRGRRVETEDEILEIEDALFEILEAGETWDGHEVGASSRDVSVVTPDAEATFARLSPFLSSAGLIDHVTVAARPLAGGALVTLWPRGGPPFDRR